LTDACYLARGAQPLRKPTTCEQCYGVEVCLMYKNFREQEKKIADLKEDNVALDETVFALNKALLEQEKKD
jgi:hypothetical protein